MVAEKLRVTAETQGDRRNFTKLLSSLRVFTLSGLVVALLTAPLLLIDTPENFIGVNNVQSPAGILTSHPTPPQPGTATEQASESYGRLPLSFEANRGQAGEAADFVARGAGYTLSLTPTEAVFSLAQRSDRSRQQPPAVLRMNLVGASRSAKVAGLDELEGKVNYLIGKDPAKWRTDVPTFGRVRYAEVYPGIDVVYYGNQRRLEYDFVVAPGRDARTIELEFAGAQKVEIDAATGDLLLRVGEETVRQHAPVTYQETAGGGRREVESRYALRDGGQVGFEVGEYDRSRALVIDPTLVYSTYFGGSAIEQAPRIAVDSVGNAYVTGTTFSTDFPTTVGAFDRTIMEGAAMYS